MSIKEIKKLASSFSPEELDMCIDQQLKNGTNACFLDENTERVINQLSKAAFVKTQMKDGVPMMTAVRDLARRIRLVQQGFAAGDEHE